MAFLYRSINDIRVCASSDTPTPTQLTLCKYVPTLHCRTHYAGEDSLGEETHVVLSNRLYVQPQESTGLASVRPDNMT